MRVLTRYKYVQIRVFRPLRRTRRTFCLVLCTALLFGFFTLVLEIFSTSDRYRIYSMVPYSGNLSEVQQHLVSSVIRAPTSIPERVHEPVVKPWNPFRTKAISHKGGVQMRHEHKPKYMPPNSTRHLISGQNKSHDFLNANKTEYIVHHEISKPFNSHPHNTSLVPKGKVASSGNGVKAKSKYLSYTNNFTYPLDINIVALVSDAIKGLEYTKHQPINPHNFWYLHKPNNCAFKLQQNATKNVLVLVKSFAGNLEQREALRTLWNTTNDPNMRRVFMLGYRRSHQLAIDNESRKYHDIIQENFIDNYMNNTFKTIMAYNWATKYCRRAHVILFLDDDYLVNMTVMAAHIRAAYKNQSSGLYTGTLAKHAPPYRNKNERWYLSYQQYPYDEFPPYVGGGAYVVSYDVAKKFKFAFPYVQYMGIDDVYLGIVARKLGISAKNDPYLNSHSKVALAKECSHNASELLRKICPLSVIKKQVFRVYNRRKQKPVSATVFVVCFGLAMSAIVMLSCCLSD
ncbi:lactosylceramide 1,3-N-acetyl-beta-D-glucosaminyltransferase-like [Ylistrum balloti]|uniref:lactosylceramide 1,3-N-acetyl-beta-D-glucosaminyltransferase-like n=1 Tax=Ylistrum balloti TaxID=509963 RepID=UPI002905834C|nr:lactosylceramide 1,3-N-acetyl-beta-D-glucosaminyltransferase-like [Ylistrum balloti]